MTAVLAESVAAALKTVIDPELGYSIVDLGLVYEITAADGGVHIVLTTTTPGCPATGFIRQAVERYAASVPGVGSVEVTMTWRPRWSPNRMSEEAKTHFGVISR